MGVQHLTSAVSKVISTSTSSFNSTGVDVTAYEGPIMVGIILGACTGTGTSYVPVVESALTSGGSYSAVSGGTGTTATETSDNTVQWIVVDKRACKAFVRVAVTIGGSTPSFENTIIVAGIPKVTA